MQRLVVSVTVGIAAIAMVLMPDAAFGRVAAFAVQSVSAQDASPWAFQETFDGAPGAPQPFSSPRWQVIAGSNNLDGIMDGQTVDATPEGLIQAGHGPDCGAPIGTAHNNHVLAVDFDLLGFQNNTRPHLAYVCNEHMMTTVKAGYGVVSFMPRQAFDWAGRTGTLEFETNVYSFGREWWDVYIVPDHEMLLEIVQRNEGGGGEQLPNRGVKFSFGSEKPSMQTIDNYQLVDDWAHWQRFVEAFPNDPALNDPKTRRVFRFQISQTGWGFNVQKQDGTLWSFSGNFSRPLSFTRGLVRIEHHSYNPTKDGIQGEPWSQYTFHWDNVRFDGPALGMRPAFGPGPHMLDLMHDPGPNNVQGVTINVPPGALNNPVLVGHVDSMLQNDDVDFQNRAHWRQFRVNGGAWQDLPLLKNVPLTNGDRGWSTFEVPVSGIVAGDNRIEFCYPTRPPQATWQSNGFRVKDIEIQADPGPDPLVEAAPITQQASPDTNVTLSSDVPTPEPTNPEHDRQPNSVTSS